MLPRSRRRSPCSGPGSPTSNEVGVRAAGIGGKLRLMTHRDVTERHITSALDRIGEVGPASTGPAGRIGGTAPQDRPAAG